MATATGQSIDLQTYLSLYIPSISWMLRCLSAGANSQMFDDILQQCRQKANGSVSVCLSPLSRIVTSRRASFYCSALLINGIMQSFDSETVAGRALVFISMIRDCEESGLPKVSMSGQLPVFIGSMISSYPSMLWTVIKRILLLHAR